jgi:hypothetical protein
MNLFWKLTCSAVAVTAVTGCATMFADKKSGILIVPPTGEQFAADTAVTVDGQPVDVRRIDGIPSNLCDPRYDQVRGHPCTEAEKWILPPGALGVTVGARERITAST